MTSKDLLKLPLMEITYENKEGYSNTVTGFYDAETNIITRLEGSQITIKTGKLKRTREIRYLHLNLMAKWFDMIAKGIKKEEYRQIKPYWEKLKTKKYDYIIFSNGYATDRRQMLVQLNGVKTGYPVTGWYDSKWPYVPYYILELGAVIKINF